MTSTHAFVHRFARVLAASLLVILASASWAQDPPAAHPTDDAFDALLTLPQGLSEDSSFPASHPADVTDEASLIEALEGELESGADLNASQHGGTLLHHALRANLQDTALWLLAHGADPRLEVQVGETDKPDGHDALQLAIVFRRWRVVDALLRRPAVAPHTPRDLAFRWVGLFDPRAPQDTLDADARELARRLAWPGGWYGGCLLAAAQQELLMPMLLKTTSRTAERRTTAEMKSLRGRDLQVAAQCPAADVQGVGREGPVHVPGRFAAFKPADLALADARMSTPVLQLLASRLDTPADVRAWATLPLRRPWQDMAFARPVIQEFLASRAAPETRAAELRLVPPAALHAALDDDRTLYAWFSRLAALPLPEAMAALAEVDDAVLRRHVAAVISGLPGVPMGRGDLPGHGPPYPTPELWRAVLARLPAPLEAGPAVMASTYMTQASWPALFARGYGPTAAELLKHLEFAATSDWPAQWAQLRAATAPETVTEAVRLAAARWSTPCQSDYLAPQPVNVQALALMADSVARRPPPVVLSVRCLRLGNPQALRDLLATRLVTLPPGEVVPPLPTPPEDPATVVPHGRFVLAPRACAGAPPDAIVRAAVRGEFVVDGPGSPQAEAHPPQLERLLAIDDPGAPGCAWLVTGGFGSYREITNESSFFEGHYFVNPCVESTLLGELWRVVDGRVVASFASLRGEEGALQLKESDGPRRFLLTLPVRGGGCDGGRRAELFTWTGDAANHGLLALGGTNDPALRAFDQQCPDDDVAAACFGLASDESLKPWQPQSLADFVAENGAALRQRWIAAFLADDADALKSADVFPGWRAQALAELTASTLPRAGKRRRIARMFRDQAGMAASFGSAHQYDWAEGVTPALAGLVAWLPREDWGPLLAALGKDSRALQPLREAAQAKGDARLDCTFAQAAGQDCAAAPAK